MTSDCADPIVGNLNVFTFATLGWVVLVRHTAAKRSSLKTQKGHLYKQYGQNNGRADTNVISHACAPRKLRSPGPVLLLIRASRSSGPILNPAPRHLSAEILVGPQSRHPRSIAHRLSVLGSIRRYRSPRLRCPPPLGGVGHDTAHRTRSTRCRKLRHQSPLTVATIAQPLHRSRRTGARRCLHELGCGKHLISPRVSTYSVGPPLHSYSGIKIAERPLEGMVGDIR